MTATEHRDPSAMSDGEEHEAAQRAVVSTLRKRAASADGVGGQAAKQRQSLCPLAVSSVPSSPVADVVEQAGRSKE